MRLAAAGALLLLAGCAAPPLQLDQVQGREALAERVWHEIDARHVDPAPPGWAEALRTHRAELLRAPNDDSEAFWQALDRLAGERHDAHTRVEGPREIARRTQDRGPSLGLSLVRLEGQWVAERVSGDSAAWRAGLRDGDRLIAWDGRDPDTLWAERLARTRASSTSQARELAALRQWLDGPLGSRVATRWQRADGSPLEIELVREERLNLPRWAFDLRPSGVGVLRWNRFDLRLESELRQALRTLPALKGLVLDLRGNGGGSFDMALRLIGLLLPEPRVVQVSRPRDADKQVHRVGGAQALYRGPLLVLQDAGSASGSELLAAALQFTGRAQVLGETSCGCLLAIHRYLSLGPDARLAISERALEMPDGQRVEGRGVQPDLRLTRSLAALRAGRDEGLEAAEKLLLRAGD